MQLTKEIQDLLDLYQKETNSLFEKAVFAEKIITIILKQNKN